MTEVLKTHCFTHLFMVFAIHYTLTKNMNTPFSLCSLSIGEMYKPRVFTNQKLSPHISVWGIPQKLVTLVLLYKNLCLNITTR